jgi:hypothetical protein
MKELIARRHGLAVRVRHLSQVLCEALGRAVGRAAL